VSSIAVRRDVITSSFPDKDVEVITPCRSVLAPSLFGVYPFLPIHSLPSCKPLEDRRHTLQGESRRSRVAPKLLVLLFIFLGFLVSPPLNRKLFAFAPSCFFPLFLFARGFLLVSIVYCPVRISQYLDPPLLLSHFAVLFPPLQWMYLRPALRLLCKLV